MSTVENEDGGAVLAIQALGGGVVFETAQCDETDLCEMARKVEALVEKFAGN
jgi:hypothetical protein